MRRLGLFALALTIASGSVLALAAPVEAKAKKQRPVVTISKRYTTAGTQAPLHERRAVVPEADARFRSTASNASGLNSGWTNDPFYLPSPGARVAVNWGPFASKLPGER